VEETRRRELSAPPVPTASRRPLTLRASITPPAQSTILASSKRQPGIVTDAT
jgi:hypothetical protein